MVSAIMVANVLHARKPQSGLRTYASKVSILSLKEDFRTVGRQEKLGEPGKHTSNRSSLKSEGHGFTIFK